MNINKQANRKRMEKETVPKDVLKVSLYPKGGLGDYIIGSKFLDHLLTYAPCHIDIYCEHPDFSNAIFGWRPGVSTFSCLNAVEHNAYWKTLKNYDICLIAEVFIEINHINEKRVEALCPKLMHDFLAHSASYWKIRPDIPDYMYCLENYIRRCEIRGIDRWTALRHGDIFRIPDHWAGIYLDQAAGEKALQLTGTKDYITVNRGADMTGLSSMQTKVWPQAYYESFVAMFKKAYPDLAVVQLGSKDNAKIAGADRYILGEDMEVTKWILKNSLLHVDCEGGLVHMATQLSTMCVVIFGPTPSAFYGYEQNSNLLPLKCGNCMGASKNWNTECLKGYDEPECMYATKPERVMETVMQYLGQRKMSALKKLQFEKGDPIPTDAQGQCAALSRHLGESVTAQRTNYDLLAAVLTGLQTGARIAVVGGQNDVFPFYLEKQGFQVTVFDPSFGFSTSVSYNTAHNRYMNACIENGIDPRLCTSMALPYGEDAFDILYYMGQETAGMIWKAFEKEAARVLKPGGLLVIGDKIYECQKIPQKVLAHAGGVAAQGK